MPNTPEITGKTRQVYGPNEKHVKFDEKTGLFTPAHYPDLHIPDDLTISQFMFNYTPKEAAAGGPTGVGHFRPSPANATWLIDSTNNRTYTFAQAQARTESLAKVFHSHLGMGPDDALAIYSPNDIDYGPAIWGSFRLGGIVSGANPSYTEDELAYQLGVVGKHFRFRGLLTHPASLDVALKAAKKAGVPTSRILLVDSNASKPANAPKDLLTLSEAIEKYKDTKLPVEVRLKQGEAAKKLAFLSFSSGTTGLPKAVCISHKNLIANVLQFTYMSDGKYRPGSKALATLPYYHIYGLVVVLHSMLYLNVANVVIPKFVFEPVLDSIINQKVDYLFLVPPMVVLMTKHAAVEPRLKALQDTVTDVMVGAAPLTEELVTAFRAKFPNTVIGQGYGMTETCTVVTAMPVINYLSNGSTAGTLVPNLQIKILSLDNKPLGFGELGEVITKSPSNAISYLANQKATDETFDSEGFVHTGDEGYINENGWLFVVDRRKELIKVKGNQVAPAELEGFLLGHPAVADVCVIGIPDEYAGEAPRAYVVLDTAAKESLKTGGKGEEDKLVEDIKKFVAEKKIKYKWLTGGVEFVEVIPKNPSGKLLRRQLRDEYKARTMKAKL